MVWPAPRATRPVSSPAAATAPTHPTEADRVRRTVSPVVPDRSRRRGAEEEVSGTRPAPRSRAPASPVATAASSTVDTPMGTRAQGADPVSACSSSIHPSGDTQRSRSRPSPESATIRMA